MRKPPDSPLRKNLAKAWSEWACRNGNQRSVGRSPAINSDAGTGVDPRLTPAQERGDLCCNSSGRPGCHTLEGTV